MFLVVRELADRFIESVLHSVKGDTTEEKLTSALKSSGLLIGVLGSIILWLGVSHFNALVMIKDMEVGLSKVNELFVESNGNSIPMFVSVNEELNRDIKKTKRENIMLLTGINQLAQENKWLRSKLDTTSRNTKLVKSEYQELLGHCLGSININSQDN